MGTQTVGTQVLRGTTKFGGVRICMWGVIIMTECVGGCRVNSGATDRIVR